MAKLGPIFNDAQLINGIPANGAKLFTYVAGSSTKLATYTDAGGLTAQSNPILLNSRGEPAQPIWLTEGLSYKFVFAPSTDSDPPVSPIRTIDNITGINDASLTIDQWVDSALVPTYVSATSFTVPGDQTSIFTNKRRIKSLVTAGTAYSTVVSSVFGALTTVTVVNDSTPLDSGLSSVQLGLITPNNTSLPSVIESTRATVSATATTTPLWASTAQVQDWTGTPTITALPNAPMAGAWRMVYPAVGTIFTDNATIDVQGDANYTVQAGDKVYIEALTTTTFKVFIEKKSGEPTVLQVVPDKIQPITASVNSNSLTITLNPTTLDFRSSTLGSGTVNTRVISSAISVVVSSGSTLGTINGIQSMLAVLAIDNAGTVELAVVNMAGGVNLDESGVISTTAEGGAGAADSATVVYSTTARTNVAYRVVGFIESTQATAGTWATAPSTIQGAGGEAATSYQSVGYGQVLTDVTGSRTSGTLYYNTTKKPIQVNVHFSSSASAATVGGVALLGAVVGNITYLSFIVPPYQSYSATLSSGTIQKWTELR